MPKWAWISGALLVVLLSSSCKQQSKGGEIRVSVETRVQEPPAVLSFGIQPAGTQAADHWRYAASYTRQGKTTRFGIDLHLNATRDGEVKAGTGSFIADPRSDDALLIEDLKQVLKATKLPEREMRVRELPFRFEILGENLDRGAQGRLVDAATGNWVSVRLYLGVQQDQEVLLNFQKPGGTGELLMADPKFGDGVLRELMKVL